MKHHKDSLSPPLGVVCNYTFLFSTPQSYPQKTLRELRTHTIDLIFVN